MNNRRRVPIDVMIITHNEALNLPHSLKAVQGWTNKIFVIDSGSTDGTQDIARDHGAEVVHHDWEGYARQKNWGLRTLPFESAWILIIDADEVITETGRSRLIDIATRPVDEVKENGFFINRLTYFLGQPIRHCGYYPSWNLRFFKRGKGVYEDREVHEHVVISDPVGYIKEPMLHDDRRGLEHYVAKHNRYSSLEARALLSEIRRELPPGQEANLSAAARRRRWLKRYVLPHVPMPSLWRFLYMYVVRLGVLDGRAGLEFCRFISMYDYLVAMKLRSLKRETDRELISSRIVIERGALAIAEGADPGTLPAEAGRPAISSRTPEAGQPHRRPVDAPATVAPSDTRVTAEETAELSIDAPPPVSVVILTLNEELNIPECLASCAWCDDVHVLDSGSTDRTVQIARELGAQIHVHPFNSFGAQRNWAIDNIGMKHEWVFHLDADEHFTPELLESMRELLAKSPSEAGFYVPNKLMFMGRWLKRSGAYPTYQMRLFHKKRMRFCDYGHGQRELTGGVVGTLDVPYLHFAFSKGLTDWFAKHNRYSALEALQVLEQPSTTWSWRDLFSSDPVKQRRAWKEWSHHIPFRAQLRRLYMLFILGGIFEGRAGRTYARMMAIYEQMISLKLRTLQHTGVRRSDEEEAREEEIIPATVEAVSET
ncbi:MAG: glycosyltransferase family 2 protein [Planctomycetota bacterium]|jgi:glycosyltransferase involved in cell wall biosynthesis